MKTLKFFILVLCLNVCGQAMAQKSLVSLVKKVETLIDSMSVKDIDRHYIDMPEKPWQLIVRGNVSQTIVNMTTEGHMAGEKYSANPYLETTPAEYTGLWVGYRGYGLGYMVNVGGDKGSYFTIGLTGGAFGLNLRIHSFNNSNPNFNLNSNLIPEESQETWKKVQLTDPISVMTIFADGYYMFNGKKFSYTEAFGWFVDGRTYVHTYAYRLCLRL